MIFQQLYPTKPNYSQKWKQLLKNGSHLDCIQSFPLRNFLLWLLFVRVHQKGQLHTNPFLYKREEGKREREERRERRARKEEEEMKGKKRGEKVGKAEEKEQCGEK